MDGFPVTKDMRATELRGSGAKLGEPPKKLGATHPIRFPFTMLP